MQKGIALKKKLPNNMANIKIKRILTIGFLLFLGNCLALQAQQLKGKILDASNQEPLIGACIVVVDTSLGNCTDLDGNFILENCPAPPFNIKVTYTGYGSLIYEVSNLREPLELTLNTVNLDLETVIISAKNSQLKRDVALTVESIGLKEIENTTESSFYDALAGIREVDMLSLIHI